MRWPCERVQEDAIADREWAVVSRHEHRVAWPRTRDRGDRGEVACVPELVGRP